ncbi:hypothetical protein TBLA_0C00660 [Henningerozyma blattae CBS 6284]|uniref:Uncharacterized protein n=1 Tax=Henningerozyma blattae (strain ATCC 34711 / CBS 6284 / DSM 70876 / NBRC 10599 / NRRL Y-10934 / UCD 77-7) TaxID=1071380 RepID=I2H0I0_HENB6|nr:hypothetical protein TBLA_0C00660 [Tetrapisispora blattae CBS 6284]CCH59882.1 hypothetical protein TBLA_0C00660 [Tetrapisispora blattae CBS 6284]
MDTYEVKKARCSFDVCKCAIIDVRNENFTEGQISNKDVVTLTPDVYNKYNLMQIREKVDKYGTQNKFLLVKDVWDFDNIGVTKDIAYQSDLSNLENSILTDKNNKNDNISFPYEDTTWRIKKVVKYLSCADCDKGPIGFIAQVEDSNNKALQHNVHFLSLHSIDL